MKRFRVCAAIWALATASYASAQPAEEMMGRAIPEVAAQAPKPAPSAAKAGLGDGAGLAKGLSRVQADGRTATRGAAETRIYQQASPAVVLILTEDAFGSGSLISADGQIITNAHVVGDNDEVGVVFKPKVEGAEIGKADLLRAKVIKRDEISDLALVQVESVPAGVVPLKLGSLSAVQVGADVNAIGHPAGESWTYTRGIVSQIRRDYVWSDREDKIERRASVIQTQTPINPGNSGGPLLNDAMTIVGVNSFGEEGEGLNFAVSVDDVRAFLARPGDRRVKPASTVTAAKGRAECEPVTLAEERDEKAKGIYLSIDTDCDGKADVLAFIDDDKSQPHAYFADADEDGKIDTAYYDANHDGDFDYVLYDTDGDEEPDVRGEFRNGEDEPYRMEKLGYPLVRPGAGPPGTPR